MHATEFMAAVEAIVEEAPTYRLGGDGSDGTCDCVGLLMGAMDRVQRRKWPLHSSNYFARLMVQELREISGPEELEPGMAVIKARADTGQLNARYKRGGKYDVGDYRDFYHVGVVRDVEPLQIVHCTSGDGHSGIVEDSKLGKWTLAARIKGVDYSAEEDGLMAERQMAKIETKNGKPLRLRPSPSKDKPYLKEMPDGDSVEVLADAEGWAKVVWSGYTGYCMSEYLKMETQTPAGETVTMTMEKALAQQLLDALLGAVGGSARG